MNDVSPLIKKYIIYTTLFNEKWVPTIELDQDKEITFVKQRGRLKYDIADLEDFLHNL